MVQNRNFLARILNPLFVLCIYLFLYLPVVVLIIFSFNSEYSAVHFRGFTFKWYKQIFFTPEILDALFVSLTVALVSTFLSILLGTGLVIAGKWWKSSLMYNLFFVNIIFPDIILAICVLSIFSFLDIPVGYVSLISGHTLIGLGFVVPIVRSRFKELDPILTDASLDLGATVFQSFKKIIIPLLSPSLLACALLVFTLSLDDFMIAFFCSSPKIQTLSVYIYSMVKVGVHPIVNAISTLLLVVSSLFILIITYLKLLDKVISNG